jgi:subtilisin-like proprotein convertase family protein
MRTGSRSRTVAAALAAAVVAAALAAVPAADAGSYSPGTTTFVSIGDGTSTSTGTDPYPVSMTQEGMGGAITDVDVEIPDLYHARPWDISLLLVAPSGTAVLLKAATWCEHDVDYQRAHVSWRFSDQAATDMSGGSCPSGWWRPSARFGDESLPAPAPPAPYALKLSALNGQNPNGRWALYVHDRVAGAQGELGQGFRVHITTAATGAIIGGTTGSGPASPYPLVRSVSGVDGRLAEVTVTLIGLTHAHPDDLDVLLVGPTGRAVVLMSDACGADDVTNRSITFTSAVSDVPLRDDLSCPATFYNPTDWMPGESLPAPAPPAPYASSLTTFNGTSPNGTWRLYVNDDFSGGSGYLSGFLLKMRLRLETAITEHPRASTRNRRATFSFTGSSSAVGFECRLDDHAWEPCASPTTYYHLAVRRHAFRVRSVDAAGYHDTTPATWTWEVLP